MRPCGCSTSWPTARTSRWPRCATSCRRSSTRRSCASTAAEERKFAVVEEVKARLAASGAKVNDIDGVRVSTEDGWWLLRASNTQAVLVARCEAFSPEGLERLKALLVEQLSASGIEAPADF